MRLLTTTLGALMAALALALPVSSEEAEATHWVRVAKCNKELNSAAFVGSMRTVPDSHRMAMRFTLLERVLPGKEFQPVAAEGLAVWRKSRAGVQRFSFRQRVRGLAEAAVYRVDVEFRWLDADGTVLRHEVTRSRRCKQPGTLPNLRVESIVLRGGRYRARVVNVGNDVATAPEVQLFVDGHDVGALQLADILPRDLQVAEFVGPSCAGSVQAVVDPSAAVRESVEDDNALTLPCAELERR